MINTGPRVVVMALIPGKIDRGSDTSRTGVPYAKYSIATWRWWCAKNNIEFITLDHPLGGKDFEGHSPTLQRWCAVKPLFERYGPNARIAFVDADTMVKWDCPNFFDICSSGFAATLDTAYEWSYNSIIAYSSLFPGVSLMPEEYFNVGVVVLGHEHVPVIDAYIKLVTEKKNEIRTIQLQKDVGSDQTIINFICKQIGVPICELPKEFNRMHCYGHIPWDSTASEDWKESWIQYVLGQAKHNEDFDFMKDSFIWHFTSSVPYRVRLMSETWARVRWHYSD